MQGAVKLLAGFALLCGWASAAVTDSSANGFTVKVALNVQASPDDVYRKFVHNIGDWWDAAHTFSKDSHNLSIEERPGGCFCEKLPGGGVRHMEVVYVSPGVAVVLSGGLGPLQSLAATGTLTISFQKGTNGGTTLDVTYAVSGYLPQGMNTWAAPVDGVITSQFTRLKNFAEKK